MVELTHKRPARADWRNLLSTRQGTIAVALATALIAAGILVFAMHRYRQSVDASAAPQTVFVASGLIQKGTSGEVIGSHQLFKPTKIIAKQVRAGAVADESLLHGKVAATDIYPGQQLTLGDFTAGGGIAAKLAANQRAVSVPLDTAHGLIGQVHAGDRVDVYAGFLVDTGTGRPKPFLRLLIPNVPVLKQDESSTTGLGGQNGANRTSDVTLQVDDRQAARLAFASDNGKLWLALRPANASAPDSRSVVSLESILFGSTALPVGRRGL